MPEQMIWNQNIGMCFFTHLNNCILLFAFCFVLLFILVYTWCPQETCNRRWQPACEGGHQLLVFTYYPLNGHHVISHSPPAEEVDLTTSWIKAGQWPPGQGQVRCGLDRLQLQRESLGPRAPKGRGQWNSYNEQCKGDLIWHYRYPPAN